MKASNYLLKFVPVLWRIIVNLPLHEFFVLLILALISSSLLWLYFYLPTVTLEKIFSSSNHDVPTIGLIADTHIPNRAEKLPKKVFTQFRKANVDYIVHAGDITSFKVIQELATIAPVIAVHGNHDPSLLCKRFPAVTSFHVAEKTIGVWHHPNYFFRTKKMRQLAHKKGFDVLVIGHTHKQKLLVKGGVLFVNPGSPTCPIPPFLVKPSIAVLILTSPPHVSFIQV